MTLLESVLYFMTDAERLDDIVQELHRELRKRGADTCVRNLIQMMFILHYADWLEGAYTVPACALIPRG